MRIEADGYAYWCDEKVEIGDDVIVSVSQGWNLAFGATARRTVTRLTTDYDGPCESVLHVIEKSEKSQVTA